MMTNHTKQSKRREHRLAVGAV